MWLIFYGLVAHFFATNTPKIATKGKKLPPKAKNCHQTPLNCHKSKKIATDFKTQIPLYQSLYYFLPYLVASGNKNI